MKKTKALTWMLALILALFTSHCDEGNGEVVDADAQDGDVPAEGEVDVQVDDVQGEDIQPEEVIEDPVAEDITDVTEADGPETVTITGQVWSYTLTMDTMYYAQPEGDITVTVEGEGITTGDLTATTLTDNCEESTTTTPWWDLGEPFACGKFTISGVPAGAEIMLRASGLGDTGPETISKIFTAQDGDFVLLVIVSQDLIDALLDAAVWNITQDPANGMIVGLLASSLNPDAFYKMGDATACPTTPASCVVSGFIGAATVAITPDPGCAGCNNIIYFDSADYANLARTDTDPDQSLFFVTNSPPHEMTDPYTIATDAGTTTIDDATFAVEAGTITYLLLMP